MITSSIIHKSIRKINEPLNILTACAHERYEQGLAKTGHSFYSIHTYNQIKNWNTKYGDVPKNYVILDCSKDYIKLPNHINFDLCLSHNKFSQFQTLAPIAQQLQIPLVSLEHTVPSPDWPSEHIQRFSSLRGSWNVFITAYSINAWNWIDKNDTCAIYHCIDNEIFQPGNSLRNNHILSVNNDFINRNWCLNFEQFIRVTKNLPTLPIGDTPNFSKPAQDIHELAKFYQTSRIYLNTAHVSPVPMSLLESMACGCAPVSINACAIPEYIEHGVNGFLANNDKEMRYYLELLLDDEELATNLGVNAAQTVKQKCNVDRFLLQWEEVFQKVLL